MKQPMECPIEWLITESIILTAGILVTDFTVSCVVFPTLVAASFPLLFL